MDGGTIRDGGAWRSPYLTQYMPIAANVGDDEFYGNIRSAVARALPWLQQADAHNGHAVIVGGGPSLIETLPEIRWRKELGQTIVALNNTARFLIEHGIKPDYHVLLDARASNARFVIHSHPIEYLIASQCAPETFRKAKCQNVTLWHPHVAGIHDIIGDRETALIGGGTTVGLQAISIMLAKGYRKIHLYGFDSSYRDGDSHAYAQPENVNDEIIDVEVNGRGFRCARWMAHQADEFRGVAAQVVEAGGLITVAGDGLLPYIAKIMANLPADDAACYDMERAPASWDFTTWLIKAEMKKRRLGATGPLRVAILPGPKDGFRDDNLPVDAAGRKQFLERVMRPALDLIGAVEDASSYNGHGCNYLHREISDAARTGEDVPRFEAPPEARARVALWLAEQHISDYLTVTLREADHWQERNSNVAAWLEFAKTCGRTVVFVRDTARADHPLPRMITCPAASKDLHIRAALYEQADCNLFTSNGPFNLALFSAAPYLMFKPLCPGYPAGTSEWWAEKVGIPEGTQAPWATDKQRIVWADDTLENISTAFNAFPQTEKVNGTADQ